MGAVIRAPHVVMPSGYVAQQIEVMAWAARAGWRVLPCGDAPSVFDHIGRGEVDIIIADEKFAPFDLTLLAELRQQYPYLPMVLLREAAEQGDRVADQLSGARAVEVLDRNAGIGTLSETIQRMLRQVDTEYRESRIYRHVAAEVTRWQARTSQIADVEVPLSIARRLHRAGLLSQRDRLQLELAFQEALTNSIEHGNLGLHSSWREEFDAAGVDRFSRERALRLQDPTYADRCISVDSEFTDGVLVVAISDQGAGFEPGPPQPAALPAGQQLHGRGLAMIREYMDDVHFEDHGRRIVMTRRITPRSTRTNEE